MSSLTEDIHLLSRRVRHLLDDAVAGAAHAYNPYSQFFVGAAVETASGGRYRGTFMDNISFGLSICAEPAAIMAAITAGDRQIERLAVVGGPTLTASGGEVITPCGRCRQILHEVACMTGEDIEVYCANMDLSQVLMTSADELLPNPFTP